MPFGFWRDAAVAGTSLTAIAERLDGPAAFAAGQMTELLVVEAQTNNRLWRSAHKSMTRRTAWFT